MYVLQPDGSYRRLWPFQGGLHLPVQKTLSNIKPVTRATLPERLVLPLQQHIGMPSVPLVQPGEQVLKGQMLAAAPQGTLGVPLHAPTSGRVLAIGPHPVPHPSGLSAPCISMTPDGQDAWWPSLPEPMLDYPLRTPAELRERIHWAGVVGLGGAAFPSSVKLTQSAGTQIETLILNGVECEPYITCDDLLMRTQPERVLEGARILLHICGAKQCLIGIEDDKPEAIAAMYAIAQTPDFQNIHIVSIPTLYPSGGERQLIRLLTGLEVPSQGLPAQIGVLCHNVATAAAIADAVLTGRPLISRIITITGQGVQNPCNLEVLIGTLIADLIPHAGGYTTVAQRLILGGPMMGLTLATDALPVVKATNCLVVASLAEAPEPRPALPCIRCGACALACPANLLPQQLYWYSRARDLAQAQAYHLFDCIECGCCSQVCPSHLPLVQYYRATKAMLRAKDEEHRKADQARLRHDARQARLQRQEEARQARLRQRQAAVESAVATTAGTEDPKKAIIEAAIRRVAAKKQAMDTPSHTTAPLIPESPSQGAQVSVHDVQDHA